MELKLVFLKNQSMNINYSQWYLGLWVIWIASILQDEWRFPRNLCLIYKQCLVKQARHCQLSKSECWVASAHEALSASALRQPSISIRLPDRWRSSAPPPVLEVEVCTLAPYHFQAGSEPSLKPPASCREQRRRFPCHPHKHITACVDGKGALSLLRSPLQVVLVIVLKTELF